MDHRQSRQPLESFDFAALLVKLRSSDEQAWKTVYFVLQKYVQYWLETRGVAKTEAEQIFHDAFTLFYERFAQCEFEDFQKMRSYTLAIADKKLKEYRRSVKRRQHYLNLNDDDSLQIADETNQNQLLQLETGDVVEGLLRTLNETERKILSAYYCNGRKLKDIAYELGLSEENGWVIKHRAMKKAKQIIGELMG